MLPKLETPMADQQERRSIFNEEENHLLRSSLTLGNASDYHRELVSHDSSLDIPAWLEEEANQSVQDIGLDSTIRKYGSDTTSYQHIAMAGRLNVDALIERAPKDVVEYAQRFSKRLGHQTVTFITNNAQRLQNMLVEYHWANYMHDNVSIRTLLNVYLLKTSSSTEAEETPVQMYMRVAIQLYINDGVEAVFECFKHLACMNYTMASPTLMNAGTTRPQMSSCFVTSIEDSLDSILKGVYNCGMISKMTGGLGVDVSNIRHSTIGQVGESSGIVPMLKLFNDLFVYVDQGGSRKGASTMYLRPHHIDVEDFIKLVDPIGDHNARTYDLNICLWMPWIFWDRVRDDQQWTLFCPAKTPELNQLYGKEFEKRYVQYENDSSINKFKKVMSARSLANFFIAMQCRSGKPYLMNCDSANFKSNHKHIGYIKQSNLCCEIILYTDGDTINSCNLASINLEKLASPSTVPPVSVDEALSRVNFKSLITTTANVVKSLNKVIDNNLCPLDTVEAGKVTKRGPIYEVNDKYRAIGVGFNGMSDLMANIDLPFDHPFAATVDEAVTACTYFNGIVSAVQLAIIGGKCGVFEGSPYSQGKFQFDLWQDEYRERWGNKEPHPSWTFDKLLPMDPKVWGQEQVCLLDKYGKVIDTILPKWDDLKRVVVAYGMSVSMVMALMPTASTSKAMRNAESTELHIRNIYSAGTYHGSYTTINRHMVRDLTAIDMWNQDTIEYVMANDGCLTGLYDYLVESNNLEPNTGSRIQYLEGKYKTMMELSPKEVIIRGAIRGKYVDQAQSLSYFVPNPNSRTLMACHRLGDLVGNKTIMYYLYTKSATDVVKMTVDPLVTRYITNRDKKQNKQETKTGPVKMACNQDICISCQ